MNRYTRQNIVRACSWSLVLLLIVVALALLCTGCRTGQQCKIVNYGLLHYTQHVAGSPVVNSKETPFDVFRGLAQGSAISAAPAAQATQSGSSTFDNANPNLNREDGEDGKKADTNAIPPAPLATGVTDATNLPTSPALPAKPGIKVGDDKTTPGAAAPGG